MTMDIEMPVTETDFKEQAGEVLPKTYADFAFVIESMTYEQARQLMDDIIVAAEILGFDVGSGFRMTTDADYTLDDCIPTGETTNV